MDAGSSSIDPARSKTLPAVMTICNRLVEDSGIRHVVPSEIFCPDPNPVQVPSCVKDSKCELYPFYIKHSFQLIRYLAELDVLLNGLTEDSIDRSIALFRDAIATRQFLPSDFAPGHAQIACDRILSLTARGSTSMEDIRGVPRFWVNLDALAHSSNLTILESCIARVFCMRGALTLHHWLLNVVTAAVEGSSRSTWIDKLVWDVKMAMDQKQSKDFDSEQYLPNLKYPRNYSFVLRKFRFDQTEILASTVSSIIRVWLQFPADELSMVQLSVIDIIMSNSPPSIMYLDKVWEAYKTPCSTFFKKWDVRRSKSRIESELKAFRNRYISHPFATPGSLEYQKLEYLDQLILVWMEKKDMVCQYAIYNNTNDLNLLYYFILFLQEYAKLYRIKWTISRYANFNGECAFRIFSSMQITHLYQCMRIERA